MTITGMTRRVGMAAALSLIAAASSGAQESRAVPTPCPEGIPASVQCSLGKDSAGAFYWIAMPAPWNKQLVVHAHGGPDLGAPDAKGSADDLTRWNIWTRMGFAVVASTYHQGGVAVRSAAEDVERSRQLFIAQFGQPERTILHGQSWGAGVAARTAELFGARDAQGRVPYDAVLLTSGVLGGASLSYDFRMDLRVVYQAVCGDHPRADEPQYPLWQGLPVGAKLTRAQLADRVDACTGVRKPAATRSPEQAQRLATILAAVKVPERTLIAHLNWGTWHFQDIVTKRTNGANPFTTMGVIYAGGAVLNDKVARYAADSLAVATLSADADPTGRIAVPVLTMHAIDDPTAFVELESTFRRTMERAGRSKALVQLFTQDSEHSYSSDAQYVSAIRALLAWVEQGTVPTPKAVAASCANVEPIYDPAKGCRFVPTYTAAPLSSRVPSRTKPGVPK
jgi:alpha-beta hydrolase superfamily lysophospholipase